MKTRLTKRTVDSAQPRAREYVVWDSEVKGFGLKVTPSGSKSYLLYYRTRSQQQRKPKIGNHGSVTVDQARQIAKTWLAESALGGDVSGDRKADRTAQTVTQLAEQYLSDYAEVHKKPSSVKTDRANIENHVIPLIGGLKVKDVTRADIDRLKLDIKNGKTARQLVAKARGRRIIRGGSGIANRVLALLSKMFSCSIDWGYRDDNPALGIRKFKEKRKDRFLSDREIYRLIKALDEADTSCQEKPTTIAGIRLLLFTGLRLGEVTSLEWDRVDFSKGLLHITDGKSPARTVPVNTMAIDALKRIYHADSTGVVLEGWEPGKPVSLTRPWYRIRERAGIDATANLHSLRHTFASWSVMTGLTLPQVGAVLGHKSAQTTLRYADHLVQAVQQYSQHTGDTFKRISKEQAAKSSDEFSE